MLIDELIRHFNESANDTGYNDRGPATLY